MCIQPILPRTAPQAAAKCIFRGINYFLWHCDNSLEAKTAVGSHSCDCAGRQATPGKPQAALPPRLPPTPTAPAASTRRCWRSPPPGCSFPLSRSRGQGGGRGIGGSEPPQGGMGGGGGGAGRPGGGEGGGGPPPHAGGSPRGEWGDGQSPHARRDPGGSP